MEEKVAIKALGALAQETRLRIVKYLIEKGVEGATAGEIAEAVEGTSSRVSFHLSNLENAGLIQSKRKSRFIIYAANFTEIGDLISFLMHDCCGGNAEIQECCNQIVC